MTKFIEITYQGNTKYCINVNQIVWYTALPNSGKTTLILFDGTRFTIDESYGEIVAKIEAATATPSTPTENADVLKASIKSYNFDGVSEDFADGWSSAIKWCLDKVDKYLGGNK